MREQIYHDDRGWWVLHSGPFKTREQARHWARLQRLHGGLPGVVHRCACGHSKGQHDDQPGYEIHRGPCCVPNCRCEGYRYWREPALKGVVLHTPSEASEAQETKNRGR